MTTEATPKARAANTTARRFVLASAARAALVAICSIAITVFLILPLEQASPACAAAEATCMRTWSDAVYWTLTTMTTTGYGDITPKTPTGRAWAVTLMVGGLLLAGQMVDAMIRGETSSRDQPR